MLLWIENQELGATERSAPTASLLRTIAKLNLSPSTTVLCLDLHDLQEEELVNFTALLQKSWKHVAFMLGYHSAIVRPCRVWQRYRKNLVNRDHGEDMPFETLLASYIREHFYRVRLDGRVVRIECEPSSSAALAAMLGRLVNMARWCVTHTPTLKLVSEAPITWKNFHAISVLLEQPITRRPRRL